MKRKREKRLKTIGVPLESETIEFFRAKADAERRTMAAVVRMQLEDIVKTANQQQPQECSTS